MLTIPLAAALAAGAVALLPTGGVVVERRRAGWAAGRTVRRMVVTAAGAMAVGVLLAVPVWAVLASTVGAALVVRLIPERRTVPPTREIGELAGVLDLLATCLDAGMPVGRAIAAVLGTVPGPPDRPSRGASGAGPADRCAGNESLEALAEVAALLALGSDPRSAWRSAAGRPELAALAAAAQRSALGGVRLADAVRDAAVELRGRCRREADRRAARAGVAMTAPLALCFLPAFVCLGLAPVIISLVSSLHVW